MDNYVTYKGYEFCTNGYGEGLFVWAIRWNSTFPVYCQLVGTCDFDVKGVKNARRKIVEYVRKHYVEDGKLVLPHLLTAVKKGV